MSKNEKFSRCSNGHIIPYGAEFCPWCGELAGSNPGGTAGGASERSVAEENYASVLAGNTVEPPVAPGAKSEKQTIVLSKSPVAPERTIVMRPRSSENVTGRIVGFLMTYDRDPLGTYYPLHEGRETIGRGDDVTIRIDDTQLSKEHAIILYRNGTFIFEDRLSSNGTLLNGKDAIGQYELQHGDVLKMGTAKYVFVEIPHNA